MTDTGPLQVNPDCRDGKHDACAGDAWDLDADLPTTCKCWCHQDAAVAAKAPPVDPEHVKVRTDGTLRTFAHPDSPAWNMNLDVMPGYLDSRGVMDDMVAWAAQRALEQRILEDMAALLKSRPKDAPGVLLVRSTRETYLMESAWIPSGTIIYSMDDQPDLMAKVDPEDDRVLYYRQGNTKA